MARDTEQRQHEQAQAAADEQAEANVAAQEARASEARVYRQQADAHGRVLLDRPLLPHEAAEQDAANREAFAADRAARFGATAPPPAP